MEILIGAIAGAAVGSYIWLMIIRNELRDIKNYLHTIHLDLQKDKEEE